MRAELSIHAILGWPLNKKSGICPIPGHTHVNYTPSFAIYRSNDGERWICYSPHCPSNNARVRGGDAIDLLGYLNISGYRTGDSEYRKMALRLSPGVPKTIVPEISDRKSNLSMNKYLPISAEALEYALSRGISIDVIERLGVGGTRHALAIPTIEFGKVIGIKFRAIKPNKMRFWMEKGSRKGIFNFDNVCAGTGTVLVAKSEIAAMVIMSHLDVPVCAPNTGEETDPKIFDQLSFASRLVWIGDNDTPGFKASERFLKHGFEVRHPPAEYKDVDEWLLKDPEAKQEIQNWI